MLSVYLVFIFFFFKQKTAYEMRISDWSSDVCSSDLPGDRPDRMEKALGLGADALILDLEDAVAPDAKPAAREAVAAFLGTPRAIPLFVRINALDSDFTADDLAAMLPAVPAGIVLPKAEGDRKSDVSGKSVSLRVNTRGRLKI